MIDFEQFQLWPNCNNNCPFCFNKGTPAFSSEECISNINDIISFINERYSGDQLVDISFIGGEFFDTQLDDLNVKTKFYELFDECKKKIESHNIRRVLVCTSLLFDISKHLIPFLDYAKSIGILDKILLCTSFDFKYRFKTNADKDLWESNMTLLNSRKDTFIHTEMILTQFAIDEILSSRFSISEFQKKFTTRLDFIEPTFVLYYGSKEATLKAIPGFFPTRNSFLKFVNEMCLKTHQIDINGLLNLRLRSKSITFKNPKGEWAFVKDRWSTETRRTDRFGNKVDIYTYSDSDLSMVDDLKHIKENII